MNKKVLSTVVSAGMVVTVSACGSGSKDAPATPSSTDPKVAVGGGYIPRHSSPVPTTSSKSKTTKFTPKSVPKQPVAIMFTGNLTNDVKQTVAVLKKNKVQGTFFLPVADKKNAALLKYLAKEKMSIGWQLPNTQKSKPADITKLINSTKADFKKLANVNLQCALSSHPNQKALLQKSQLKTMTRPIVNLTMANNKAFTKTLGSVKPNNAVRFNADKKSAGNLNTGLTQLAKKNFTSVNACS